MNEFALKTYGYGSKLIELYSRQKPYIKQFFVRDEEHIFKKDKKLNLVYRVVYRHKNNEKYSCANNEFMLLEVDSNLSPDFTFSHVDMVKQTAFTISVLQIEQPRSFQTKIIVLENYVNEQQELFENKTFFNVETLAGTLAKRFAHYKSCFDEHCKNQLEKYLKNGIPNIQHQLLENFTSYLLYKWNIHYGDRCADINKILTMYSALHDDCFHGSELEYEYHRYPYGFWSKEDKGRQEKPFLFAYQQEVLDEIDSFFRKNMRAFEEMHHRNCNTYWNGSKIKYYDFKNDFLEMWERRNDE